MKTLERRIFYRDVPPMPYGLEPGRRYYYQYSLETVSGGQILKVIYLPKPTEDEKQRAICLPEYQKAHRGLAIVTTSEKREREIAEEEAKTIDRSVQ